MTSPRQTQSYLRNLLQERGIHPRAKLGQNFLIDLNLIDLLLQAAELTPDDLALEVGTGTGSLTARLAQQAGHVLAVEIDPNFVTLTTEAVEPFQDRVTLIHADILQNKNNLNPGVLQAIADLQQSKGLSRLKLTANLPYAVAVPVVNNFLITNLSFERMVVTVQWEIAERLMAQPGTKDYAALAVLVQSLADVELVRKLAPSVFWPRPEVASAIVRIVPRPEKRAQVGDVVRFRNFLRDLYVHRRKNLRGALAGSPSGRRPKAEVDAKLAELGIDGTARAEDLSLEQHRQLCSAFG